MTRPRITLFIVALMLVAAGTSHAQPPRTSQADERGLRTATFAGGCFWCMEPPFDKLDGVISTTSGYIGGHTENPTYEEVSAGITGHAEAVEVVYDPARSRTRNFWTCFGPISTP